MAKPETLIKDLLNAKSKGFASSFKIVRWQGCVLGGRTDKAPALELDPQRPWPRLAGGLSV